MKISRLSDREKVQYEGCEYRLTAEAGCILTDELYYVYSVEIAADEMYRWKEVEFFSLEHEGGI